MSWFHQLSAGNSWRPPKSSVNTTGLPGFGTRDSGFESAGESDGADGVPPHAANIAHKYTSFRIACSARFKIQTSSSAAGRNLSPLRRLSPHDGTVTDETLMHAVRRGDVAKLGVLFERYRRPAAANGVTPISLQNACARRAMPRRYVHEKDPGHRPHPARDGHRCHVAGTVGPVGGATAGDARL